MTVERAKLGSRFFPDIRVFFRSAENYVPTPLQALFVSTLLAGAAFLAYGGGVRIGGQHLLGERRAAAAHLRAALDRRLSGLEARLAALAAQPARAPAAARTPSETDRSLGAPLPLADMPVPALELSDREFLGLDRDRHRLDLVGNAPAGSADGRVFLSVAMFEPIPPAPLPALPALARGAALADELAKLDAARATNTEQYLRSADDLAEAAQQFEELSAIRGAGATRGRRARLVLDQIGQKLTAIGLPPPDMPEHNARRAEADADDGPALPQPIDGGAVGPNLVGAVERTLRAAGIDVDRMLAQLAQPEGGPFVPPPAAGSPSAGNAAGKLAALQALARTLPIAAPLARYAIGSPFGPRRDPFNHRLAFHTGIDLDAPYSSPVYATAPGTVIFSGWLGDYGQTVEIDHGFGIVTLYAHLRRRLVAVGQNVPAQAEIGLVGTTGRSTGPHVHYEVRVDGQPQDPEKFLALARLLPVAAAGPNPAVGGPAENSR